MRRTHIILGVLVAIAAVGSAGFTWPTFPVKKGMIDSAWVEPQAPIVSNPVTLHVTMADPLELDRVEVRNLATLLMIKLYWEAPADDNGAAAHLEEPLGTLDQGRHMAYVQSFYQGRPVDSERISFEVKPGPSQGTGDQIDNLWIDPAEPKTSDTVTVHISGRWPTPGYTLVALSTAFDSGSVTIDMGWTSLSDPVIQVVTAYEETANLFSLSQGTYWLQVNCYLDHVRVDWAEMCFEVKPGGPSLPPDIWPWDWWLW